MPKVAETLLQTPFFQGLDEPALRHLVAHVHEKTHAKGEQIFNMGDRAERFFVLVEGWVKLYRTSREGEEVIIHIFGPGESFAAAAVFNDHQTYPVSAEAVDDVRLIEIPRSYFVEMIEKDSSFALKILGVIAARQHYLVQQLEQITTRTAPQRIGTFLLKFCRTKTNQGDISMKINLPYDKSLISARLNIQPETFSRALAKLEPYGVAAEGRSISIHNPKALAEFCDLSLSD